MSTNIRRLTEEEKEMLNQSLSEFALKIDGGSIEDDTLHIEIRSSGGHHATFNQNKVLEVIKDFFKSYQVILNGTLITA